MAPTKDLEVLIAKVKDIDGGPDGDLLRRLVEILHDRFDYEPLSAEELAAVQEADEAIRRGDMSYFTPLEEYERKRGFDLSTEVVSTSGKDSGAPGPNDRKSVA